MGKIEKYGDIIWEEINGKGKRGGRARGQTGDRERKRKGEREREGERVKSNNKRDRAIDYEIHAQMRGKCDGMHK